MARNTEDVRSQLTEWARDHSGVRVMLLTGSRTQPAARVDALSDYDIILYVRDVSEFQGSDDWLSTFGEVMVRWPRTARSTGREGWITRLAIFADGVRIDFQIGPDSELLQDALDEGYEVLMDKDGLASALPLPTYAKYLVTCPTEVEYAELVNDFWWDATYVAKYLMRDELPFASFMLGGMLRDQFLHTMISWHLGSLHDWQVNVGVHGRHFKKLLEQETWEAYESTFPKAEIEDHWQAFLDTLALFRGLAVRLAERLGYHYLHELDQNVSRYCQRIRERNPNS